jgi:hypothetical protein
MYACIVEELTYYCQRIEPVILVYLHLASYGVSEAIALVLLVHDGVVLVLKMIFEDS